MRFILVGHKDYQNDIGKRVADDCAKALGARGLDVGEIRDAAVTPQEARTRAREALKDEPDGIVLFIGTWLEAPVAIAAVREVEHLPLAVWAFPMFDSERGRDSTGSFVAWAVVKGTLERMGLSARFLLGLPEDQAALDAATAFARAAYAVSRLKRTTIGLIGYASMGMYTGTIDHTLLRSRLGPELDQADTYVLLNRAERVGDEEVLATIGYLRSRARIAEAVTDDQLITTARLTVALRHLVAERRWDAANVKCQYELSQEYGMTACVPVSLLADAGIIAGCEGDVPCSVAQCLLAYLSDSTPWYADLLDFDGNELFLSPCGFAPLCLTADPPGVTLGAFEHPGFSGVHVSAALRAGTVTIAQLAQTDSGFRLMFACGEGLQCELRQGWAPALRIHLRGGTKSVITSLASQHVALCYGDVSAELKDVCGMLGIEALPIA